MNKSQHVGDILYAQENKQVVEYQRQPLGNIWISLINPIDIPLLIKYPERYRIKATPTCTYCSVPLSGHTDDIAFCSSNCETQHQESKFK